MNTLQSVLVVTHSDWKGASHFLVEYLLPRVPSVKFLEVPFPYSKHKYPRLSIYQNGALAERKESRLKVGRGTSGYLAGALAIWMFALRFEKPQLVIAADAFNTANMFLLKTLRRWGPVVFYSIDYVPIRFENAFLNRLYHFIDRFAIRRANLVWNLSPRMSEGRISRDGNNLARDELVVPIGCKPIGRNCPRLDSSTLVFVGHLIEKQGLQLVLEALPRIAREVPQVSLKVIGEGPYETSLHSLSKDLGLESRVQWVGRVDDSEVLFKHLADGVLGLAPYKPAPDNFTYYADPTKIKDYLGAGLPVILTGVPAVSEEIQRAEAGVVIPYEKEALEREVIRLLTDRPCLEKLSGGARRLAKDYAWDRIFENALSETLQRL